jgi:hypothetical protein
VLPDINDFNGNNEDIDVIIRSVGVKKKSPPHIRLISVLHRQSNRSLLEGVMPKRDIICMDDLKCRLL